MSETLAQIGEKELIQRLRKFVPAIHIEDDTASILRNGNNLLINTDVLVDQIHFNETTISAEDLGWKAIATNLSDLAASGADEILGVTVGLISPGPTTWSWVENVYRGMDKALQKFGGEILGGDCSTGKEKILSITAIGTFSELRLHRSFAQPGDHIVVSDVHGLSRLGLALKLSEDIPDNTQRLSEQIKNEAILKHCRPSPPLKALKILKECKPSNLPWRAAGTDSSDGLLDAVQNLAIASNCRAILNPQKVPRHLHWPSGAIWDDWCLNGGEDFELVLSLPPLWADEWLKAFPTSKAIGIMGKGSPGLSWTNGKEINPFESKGFGFKHFS